MSPAGAIDENAVLGQLTIEEKISLLSGATNWRTSSIHRLGIRAVKVRDRTAMVRLTRINVYVGIIKDQRRAEWRQRRSHPCLHQV
jgi:hypothetical protein